MEAKFNHLFTLLVAASLTACDAAGPTPKQEGQYGASSGPNPNLADLQRDKLAPSAPDATEEPATDDAMPQADGESGRSSPQAGATDETGGG